MRRALLVLAAVLALLAGTTVPAQASWGTIAFTHLTSDPRSPNWNCSAGHVTDDDPINIWSCVIVTSGDSYQGAILVSYSLTANPKDLTVWYPVLFKSGVAQELADPFCGMSGRLDKNVGTDWYECLSTTHSGNPGQHVQTIINYGTFEAQNYLYTNNAGGTTSGPSPLVQWPSPSVALP